MFNLYNDPLDQYVGSFYPGGFQRVLNRHQNNVRLVQSYYRHQSFAVASNHPLVSLLNQCPEPTHPFSAMGYYEQIEVHTDRLTRAFHWSGLFNQGEAQTNGPFYQGATEEITLIYAPPFGLDWEVSHWEDWAPIRCLSHESGNLYCPIGALRHHPSPSGLSVTLVNLPLLATQYALWKQAQTAADEPYELTPMQFLVQYPLANAVGSFQDVAFLNRILMVMQRGSGNKDASTAWVEGDENTHPFYLNGFEDATQEEIESLVDRYRRTRWSFETILNAYPAIMKASLQGVMAFPSIAKTRPLWWVLTIARLSVYETLIHWSMDHGGSQDRTAFNAIRHSLKTLQSHRTLNALVQPETREGLLERVERLREQLD